MSYPGVLLAQRPHAQQYYTEQPHQQQHFQKLPFSEVLEMRPRTGFSRLPQDSPVQPQFTNQMETPMANGTMALNLAPDYKPPPSYVRDDSNLSTNPFVQQHNYEELPYPRINESSTDDVKLEDIPRDLQRQGSQAEVDQYYNQEPVRSISNTPLTIDAAEKKPRKKVNPIYDQYQGPADTITKTKGGSQNNLKFKSKSSGSITVRCLRHPITTILIFVLVAVVIIALVLLMLGTIDTPGSGGTSDKQVQPSPTPMTTPAVLDPKELAMMIQQQGELIETLKTRIATLENMLGGSEVNASLSAKVAMNTVKIDKIVSDVNQLTGTVDRAESTLSNTLTSLENTKTRTTTLETRMQQLNTSLGALNAVFMSQVTGIHDQNNMQDATIATLQQDVSNVEQRFSSNLNEVNRTIFDQLEVISKMPGPKGYNGSDGAQGPPGPRGAGDLSQCESIYRMNNAAFGSNPTNGPSITAPSDKVITGFSCSTPDNEALATLHTSGSAPNFSYQCKCTGGTTSTGNTQRTCHTNYWQCPKNS